MSYNPTTYWPDRFARQGFAYVAKGGREASYYEQQHAISIWLMAALEGKYTYHMVDFGCGVGRFAAVLANAAQGYTGVDIVDGAMALNPFKTARALPPTYDGVAAIQVFQHIPDDQIVKGVGDGLDFGGHAWVVDQIAEPNPGDHMHYRSPERVAELMGCAIESRGPDIMGHWTAVMRKG